MISSVPTAERHTSTRSSSRLANKPKVNYNETSPVIESRKKSKLTQNKYTVPVDCTDNIILNGHDELDVECNDKGIGSDIIPGVECTNDQIIPGGYIPTLLGYKSIKENKILKV